MSPNQNILLTGGRAPATLHLARLLKKKGHQVYVADTFEKNLTAVSQYVKKSFVTPFPRQAPKAFVNTMRKIIKDYDIHLLIPTCEETFHVSLHKKHFEKYCKVFTSDISVLEDLHNKWFFNQLLAQLELPYPKSYLTGNYQELEDAAQNLGEFVAKPTYSRFADSVIINDSSVLRDIIINENQTWLAQEFIEGKHFCSFSIADEGSLTAHSVYPVTYRVGNGSAVYFEAVDVPKIEAIVTKIVEEKNYTGFIAFDFIQSYQNGQYYTLECNPRLTSGIHLFDEKDAFLSFDKNSGICYPKEENRMMLTMAVVVYNLLEQRSFSSTKDILQAMLKAKDVVFSWKDLKPFFAQFLTVLHFYIIAKQQNISILEATTYHIEWNGKLVD